MLLREDGVFLRLATGSAKRVLHPARIVRVERSLFTAQFEDPSIRPAAGQEATLFFSTVQNDFMQQPVRIDAVMEGEALPTFGFVALSDPVSAESRQSFRVSTVLAGVIARLSADDNCPVLDISATGFSVISGAAHPLGIVLPAALKFDGKTYDGAAVIQSIATMPGARYRYGLHHAAAGSAGLNLRRGLEAITSGVQRMQLQRRARA